MDESLSVIAVTTVAFLLGGLIKGVIAVGLPTAAMGVMGLVMTPAKAAALLVIPSLVTNVWQFLAGPAAITILRRFALFLVGVCTGIFAGGGMLTGDISGRATIGLGITLAVYAVMGLSGVRFRVPPRAEPWLSPVIGLVTGLLTAATGVFVIPAVPYFQALALDREELVQALGLSFSISTAALAITLANGGVLQMSVAGASLLALVPTLLGMLVGQLVRTRISAATFRICFFVGMLILGSHLALRTVF